jgi:hypothetical protein
MQRGKHLGNAGGQLVAVLAELDREPVAGVHRRDRAEHVPQPGVVADQCDGTGPGRQRVQALDQH